MRHLILIGTMMIAASVTAQAGQLRSLSLVNSDKTVQDTRTAEQVSAVDTQRKPLPPKAADATAATETPEVNEKPKYMGRPPGVDMSRPSRMKAAAMSQRRAPSHIAGMEMRRPRPRHWSAARIVATLHHYGIYW